MAGRERRRRAREWAEAERDDAAKPLALSQVKDHPAGRVHGSSSFSSTQQRHFLGLEEKINVLVSDLNRVGERENQRPANSCDGRDVGQQVSNK